MASATAFPSLKRRIRVEAASKEAAKKEAVNHPAHYGGDVLHEVWKCLEAWGLHLNAYVWNCVKYCSRAGKKDPLKVVEDLKKARWYLDREIERLERLEAQKP